MHTRLPVRRSVLKPGRMERVKLPFTRAHSGGVPRGAACGKVACTSWRARKAMSSLSGSGFSRIPCATSISWRWEGVTRLFAICFTCGNAPGRDDAPKAPRCTGLSRLAGDSWGKQRPLPFAVLAHPCRSLADFARRSLGHAVLHEQVVERLGQDVLEGSATPGLHEAQRGLHLRRKIAGHIDLTGA